MGGWFEGLRKTRERWAGALAGLFGGGKASEADWEELLDSLIMADVPVGIAERLVKEAQAGERREGGAREALRAAVVASLPDPAEGDWMAEAEGGAPKVLLLVGINGSGKTTTAAKLARLAMKSGKSPLLGAADTFRAAGSQQLRIWADRLGCDVVAGATGADAAAAAYDAAAAAAARGRSPVIVDTAGRMHTKEPLMRELQKLRGALGKRIPGAPHETWAVLDGMLGQNSLSQAKLFHEATPLTGVVATKLDGSSKAGFLMGLKEALGGVPIRYAGLGEGEEDLRVFDREAFAAALVGEEARSEE